MAQPCEVGRCASRIHAQTCCALAGLGHPGPVFGCQTGKFYGWSEPRGVKNNERTYLCGTTLRYHGDWLVGGCLRPRGYLENPGQKVVREMDHPAQAGKTHEARRDHNHGGPLTVAIVGAGARFRAYERKYIKHNPQRIRVVAVADPDPERRRVVASDHDLPADHCFESYEQVATRPSLADAVVNTTMDTLHYDSAMALLEAGYDMLLEKPIAPHEWQVRRMIETSLQLKRRVMICHEMRYSPFYSKVKQLVADDQVGRVMSIAASEYVAYDHMAGAFVRGKWRNTQTAAPMIVAKCCHDMDMIVWLMEGIRPLRVASFGSLMHFHAEHAPPGSSDRCANDCEVERNCSYSAISLNLRRVSPELARQAGPIGEVDDATVVQDHEALRGDSPYGRCVWQCDNNVVDHQMVIIEFEGGATCSLNMIGNAARPTRDIHIVGTEGEIQGDLREGKLHLRKFNPYSMDQRFTQQTFDIPLGPDPHGGSDQLLMEDFVAMMLNEPTSKARTRLEDSLLGHQIAFAAERARVEHCIADIEIGLK